jgi:hypothetical protein
VRGEKAAGKVCKELVQGRSSSTGKWGKGKEGNRGQKERRREHATRQQEGEGTHYSSLSFCKKGE